MRGNCQRCQKEGQTEDQDLRTLAMSCGYDMHELKVPLYYENSTSKYELLVCKNCRAEWMAAIERWFENTSTDRCRREPGTGIYIRWLGSTLEVTQEEFFQMRAEKEKK